jgi:hypothetical protein
MASNSGTVVEQSTKDCKSEGSNTATWTNSIKSFGVNMYIGLTAA